MLNNFIKLLLFTFYLLPQQSMAVLTNDRDVFAHCTDPSQIQSKDACMSDEMNKLSKRKADCYKLIQELSISNSQLNETLKECVSNENIMSYRATKSKLLKDTGQISGLPVSINDSQLIKWVNYTGTFKLNISKIISAKWSGELKQNHPDGNGILDVELEYVEYNYINKVKIGKIILEGSMRSGSFDGPVQLTKHPYDDVKDVSIARFNFYENGINKGLSKSELCSNPDFSSVSGFSDSAVFYGGCNTSNQPENGVIIWTYKDTPVDISCVVKGKVMNNGETGQVEQCKTVLPTIPNYCNQGKYFGQCVNGLREGVGFEISRGGSEVEIKKGMFSNDALDGYAYHGKLSGCGMVGCSGNYIEKSGWFDKGIIKFDCLSISECSKKLSGQAFTARFKNSGYVENEEVLALRNEGSFESLIKAFEMAGNKDDLRNAKKLASSNRQHAVIEHNLLKIAGYDRVFEISLKLVNGNKVVNVNNSSALLNFYRTVNSKIPIKLIWSIKPNGGKVPINLGNYNVKLKLGIEVSVSKNSCILNSCSKSADTDIYSRLVQTHLNKSNKFKASGENELSIDGDSTTHFLGEFSKEVNGVSPLISIDSVELLNE